MRGLNKSDIVILIPVYQPELEFLPFITALSKEEYNIVLVDDGSDECYQEVFQEVAHIAQVLVHDKNKGKGRALKTGLVYIQNHYLECKGVITADADGQHSIEDIKKVAEALENNGFVLGCRNFNGKVPAKSQFGNQMTKVVFFLASRSYINDTQTGLRGFSTVYLPELLQIKGKRYEYEMNVLLWAAKHLPKIKEVSIQTIYKEGNRSSHFRAVVDSFRIYAKIGKYLLASVSSFLIDLVFLFIFLMITKNLPKRTSLILSVVIARLLSSFYNFSVNRHLVFQSNRSYVQSILQYYLLAGMILIGNCCLMYLGTIVLSLPVLFVKIATELFLFTIGYLVQKHIIFHPMEVK